MRGLMYEISDENDMLYWKVSIVNDNTEFGNIEIKKLQTEELEEIAALSNMVKYIKQTTSERRMRVTQ